MKKFIHKNSQLPTPGNGDVFRRSRLNTKGIQIKIARIIAFAILIWLPFAASASLTLPAIPSNSSLAKRFELSTELIFRVKVGETYLPSGALIATINDEIRGAQTASVLYPATGNNVYKILIFNNNASGDIIKFKYYDIFSSKVYDISQKIEFIPNQVPDYANPVILTAYCKPIDTVTGLIPENGKENVNSTLDLYWQPSPNTSYYNLFLWEDGQSIPTVPTTANIYSTTTRLYNLKYGQSYHWKIGSVNDCSSIESSVQSFKVRQLPDLNVTGIVAPANLEAGTNITLSFKIKNSGIGSTNSTPWYEEVYLSSDQTLSNDDRLLSNSLNVKQLDPDSVYTKSISFTLPNEYSGDYYFLVKTDISNSILELLEDNNIGKTLTITHVVPKTLPDILVKDILPGSLNVNPADSIAISWKVENIGGIEAAGGWAERISLIPVSGLKIILDPSLEYKLPLAVGATINRTKKFKLPDILRFSGDAKVEVELIPLPELQEYPANKANNKALSANKITVGNLLYLDIQTASVLENAIQPVRCIVTRSGDYTTDLAVSITASLAGQVTIPATVTIPTNQSSVVFNLSTVNNLIIDGTRNVDITTLATNYSNAVKSITILDDEIPGLTALLSKSPAMEGEIVTLTVTRDLVTNTPLSVSFSTNKASQWTFPTSVIIPANTASSVISVTITDDNIPELKNDAIIYASSAGFTTGQVTGSILDNDVPEVSFELLADTVSESAGVYATWGLIKRVKGDDIITVNLSSNIPNALFFPPSITLPKGALEQKFNIGVVDNGEVDGYRKVTISGSVFISSCNCGTTPENGGVVKSDLVIADNDGPSLSVSVNPISLPEGKLSAGMLTISRNTPTTNDLPITISHNDPTEVNLQNSATILAGQKSVLIPINTINDNIEDGSQMVSIQANAATFSSGYGYVFVTDQNKPDLEITDIVLSTDTALTNEMIEISGSALNSGFATAPSGVGLNLYYSKDKTFDASDILLGDFTFPSPISQGLSANFIKTVKVPNQTGNYYILAKINPTETLSELVYFNNVSDAVAITIVPEYNATAITDNNLYLPNTTVPIHGSAVNSKNEKVPNVDVDVYILSNGTRRELKVKTDNNGNYSIDFVPIPNESGHFVVGACFPKQNLSNSQDTFDIPGMRLTSGSNIIWDVKLGQILTGTIGLINTSEAPLKNLMITADKLPFGCVLKFDTISTLLANQTREFHYSLKATELTSGTNYENIRFHVQSDEGVSIDFPAYYYCQALQAQLKSDPVSINTTMTKGKSRLYELHIYNNGAGQSGLVTISLPNVNWMSLMSSATIPNMAPKDTATVVLNLTPTPDMPLNTPISGIIAVNCINGIGVQVPYYFEVVSEAKGGLKVDVIDEYTYYTDAKPHLKDAHVVVRHPFSGQILADGFTGDDGTFKVDSLPEGSYKMLVEANKHESFQTTITIDPGRVNEQSVFLSFQAITYSWEVVPTTIQDNYDVQLVMKYETSVPVPVIITEMPTVMPQLFNNETYPFMVTMTNKGLITALDVEITFPTDDPEYEFVTNFTKTNLLAQQAIQIPVVMRRRDALKSANTSQSITVGSGSTCIGVSGTIYGWQCGPDRHWGHSNNSFSFSGRICYNPPGSSTGSSGTPWFNGWFWPLVPNRGLGGSYWFNPINTTGPGVESPAVGCEPCLISLALNGIGCFPILGPVITNGAGILSCLISLADFEVTALDLADCGATAGGMAGTITPGVGCAYGLIRSAMDCYKDPPIFVSRPMLKTASTESRPSMPPILKQSLQDLTYSISTTEALDSLQNEIMGNWAWISKSSIQDFCNAINPFIKGNKSFSPDDIALLEATMAGTDISSGEIQIFTTHWNNTMNAWSHQIYSPTAQYPDIADKVKIKHFSTKIKTAHNYALTRGYENALDMFNKALATTKDEIDAGRNSVCASVSINITQKVVMTREAFEGTLTIFNGHSSDSMKEIKLNLEIKDENGVLSNDLFQIDTKALSILTGIDGTGTLGAQQKGSATVIFIPEKGAAPTVPKSYSFGGSFSYLDPFTGVTVTKPLFPVTLNVNPSPDLWLHYFMQRDILGDDPLTAKIEPIVPADFAVMVQNNGYGTANGVRIESAQPKIVENEKGLAINFALIGSNLNGQPRQMGLTNIDFGNIAPKKAAIGQWYFTSDLLGHFVSYEAKVSHIDSHGNPDLSLISGASLHELIKSVKVYSGVEDGINDFLVNEVQDALEFPDLIYLSNGGTLDVYPALSKSISGNIAAGNHEIELQVTPKQIGWNFIKFNDPGNGNYTIASVTREDGQVIPLDNVWQTFVTLPDSKEPVYENMMHFLDVFAADSPQKYTIRFTPKDQNPPEIVRFDNVPVAAITSPLTAVNVVFNRPIDPSTFNFEDMTLRIQAGPDVMDNTVTVTQLDSVTYKIDLKSKSISDGYYVLTVQTSQISSITGTKGLSGKQATWTQFIRIPAVSEFIGLPENNIGAPFDFMMLRFNLPIDKTTLLPSRLFWKKDGKDVSGGVTISDMDTDGLLFRISGLNTIMSGDGKYSLTIDLPNIKSLDGNVGILTQSVKWEIDQKNPTVSMIIPSNNGGYDSQHNTAFTIQFSENVKGFGIGSLELWKDGQNQPLSQLNFTQISDSVYQFTEFRLLTYYEGNYELKIKMKDISDLAGNKGTDTTKYEWIVKRTPPVAVTNLHISPDLGFSNTDNVTSTHILVASMMVSEPKSRIQVYQTDQVTPVLLADTSNVNTGLLELPINLNYTGNITLQAYCIDKFTNRVLTEIPVFIDEAALVSSWVNAPLVPLFTQPSSLLLSFSDKLLDDSKLMDYLKFERDGQSLGTQNLTISKSNDKLYVVSGMDQTGNVAGTYSITLDQSKLQKYNSGKQGVGTLKVQWSILHINNAPVANAGSDQSVNEGSNIVLDGSASSDADGNTITYVWTAPAGITLNSTTAASPTFTAPLVTTNTNYIFTLVVNDGTVNSVADQVVVTVLNVNKAPVANAGSDLLVNQGTIISLDGTGSSDPDGNALTYHWTAPAGITLSSLTDAKPTFTAPAVVVNTSYTLSLKVNDGFVDSPADQIVITVKTSNVAPVANAGPDLVVNQGATVSLNGTGSTDPDGNPLTYKWTAPPGITLSSTTVAKPTFIAPSVVVNTSYTLTLKVNDGLVDSPADQVVITVKTSNIAPVANAGADQVVNEGATVTLNGLSSTDMDGNPLTYRWTAPGGIILSSTSVANPTFTAPDVVVNTSYTITLIVNDGLTDSPVDQVVITVKNVVNRVPIANAGADQVINEGSTVSLDGSASSDPDGNPLTYKWTVPAGINLSSSTVTNPTFTAPEVVINTSYTLTLIVNDGFVNSTADQVIITVKQVNKTPLANAGLDQSVNELTSVTLNGSASSDPDGNPITYKWTAPDGIILSSTTVANPTFTAPEVIADRAYSFSLIVNDGLISSTVSTVTINVKNVSILATQTIQLGAGWNIISANVIPANLNIKDIFQSLIDAGKLIKVMDESGKALENFGVFGGWKNYIGDLNVEKGYKVKVTEAFTLTLQGIPVVLPKDINLSEGWNIIGYPSVNPLDAMTVFQPLIDNGKLKKVMDESGKAIENFGVFGGWKNNIGNLDPNKGYKVKMNSAGILTINSDGTKLATIQTEAQASLHFKNIFTGNGTDQMNINLIDLAKSGLEVGDEIGIFDGLLCVGSARLSSEQMNINSISLVASCNDELEDSPNGFIPGNLISMRLFRNNQEYSLQSELLNNSGNIFAKGESMFAYLNAKLVTSSKELTKSVSIKCYPNPFITQLTIEISISNGSKLEVGIFDINGQLVRNLFKGFSQDLTVLYWDGKNDQHSKMASGNYYLKVNDKVEKIILGK